MKLIHRRVIDIEIFDCGDDLLKVKGRLRDVRGETMTTYSGKQVKPGDDAHNFVLTMLVQFPDLEIRHVEGVMEEAPGEPCLEVLPFLSSVECLKIQPGFQRAVNERLGGVKGCVHFNNLLVQMAHAVLQAYWGKKFASIENFTTSNVREFINSCYVWDEEKEVAKLFLKER